LRAALEDTFSELQFEDQPSTQKGKSLLAVTPAYLIMDLLKAPLNLRKRLRQNSRDSIGGTSKTG